MALRDLARDARKNTPAMVPSGKAENLIEAAEGTQTKTHVPKQDISYKDSEISGFVPTQRSFGSKQSTDARHGSIIRNIASASNVSSQVSGDATWEECKHRKNSSGRDFCAEYHSLCAKGNCRRARR